MAKNRKASERTRVTVRGRASQDAVYAFIEAYTAQYRRSPTVREIARGVGSSESTASYHLGGLVQAGRVIRDLSIRRGISLPEAASKEQSA